MCGRYWMDEDDPDEIQGLLDELNRKLSWDEPVTIPAGKVKRGEVFPTDTGLVLGMRRGGLAPAAMRWGIPKWDSKGTVINARSESAAEKPMFREALAKRRLVVPTNGFFEWKRIDGKTQTREKYLFLPPRQTRVYLAGFYDAFVNPKTNGKEWMYVILTTQANESMAPYHDRMPVMLEKEDILPWLMDDSQTGPLLRRLQRPLVQHPVGQRQVSLFEEL